jgi:hypothetical protein
MGDTYLQPPLERAGTGQNDDVKVHGELQYDLSDGQTPALPSGYYQDRVEVTLTY